MRVFFFNDTATTEIYTLSLHDALPILQSPLRSREVDQNLHIGPAIPLAREIRGFQAGSGRSIRRGPVWCVARIRLSRKDRKSTRLNSSHANISYAVFCLKKKDRQMHHL